MRIYLSSTQTDLLEYRAAAARVLRQMGHEVIGMEEYTAEGVPPLDRCLRDAANADLYVGIFAWQYGHVPKEFKGATATKWPTKTELGKTSITEFEFRAAARKKPLVFLQDGAAWPTRYMDSISGANRYGARIRALRAELSESWLAGSFTTPEDLARQVAAAVHRRELDDRMTTLGPDLPATAIQSLMIGGAIRDTALDTIKASLLAAANMKALRIDRKKGHYWWSTRLFFLSCIADTLTATQLLIFLENRNRFVGVATPATVRDRLTRSSHLLREFDQICQIKPVAQHDLDSALVVRAKEWNSVFEKAKTQEKDVKTFVNKRDLRRWLGDDLIERSIEKEERVQTAGYLKAFLDWPHAVAPVTSNGKLDTLVDRAVLIERLAKLFVRDLALSIRQFRP
jgi:hypothetical protein